MRNSGLFVLATLGGLVAWFFSQNFQIKGWDALQVLPRGGAVTVNSPLPAKRTADLIRVATFNIQALGPSKMERPDVVDILARVCRNFDVVAIQEIRSKDDDILPRLVEAINATGRQFDFVIGPRLGRTVSKEQYAFIFDRQSIEIDRRQLYSIDDPDDLLHREPLVGWFRVRGPSPEQAFTFTLVNLHTDPDEVQHELTIYDDVLRKVRDDGRNEDDVILLGDFNADDRHFGEIAQLPGVSWAISGLPTNTRGSAEYDNLVFFRDSTREFTGRAGVYDFMREFNLTLEEAVVISDHLPVWAEFSIFEGGQNGQIASQPSPEVR